MKRIGILGGTFNPVHIGHLAIAEVAREELGLDEVIFVPSYWPPHKTHMNVVAAKHRHEMVKRAIAGNAAFSVSDFEIKKGGRSYSIDTVTNVQDAYPAGTKIFFIIGRDSLPTLHTWKHIADIEQKATFVVVDRPGFRRAKGKRAVRWVPMSSLDISSSYVRRRIATGKTVRYFLPDAVIAYIQKHELYVK